MAYMTDRKRAVGLGSAKTGTAHHWHMTLTSWALVILTPLFLIALGPMIGQPHEAVLAHFAKPFPAIATALMLVVGFNHFRHGCQVMIEDYTGGATRKVLIIAMVCLSYGAMAVGLFALARLAL
jgi:succinate dehydrogenase / fumarate reductase membrane anchor subunit